MRISVICLLNKRCGTPRCARDVRQRGFTLIELLVVLLIMGLLASVTVPNLQRLYNSVQHDAERESALGAITGLSYRAYVTGVPLTLPRGRGPLKIAPPVSDAKSGVADNAPVKVQPEDSVFPTGWQIDLADPIAFNFLGICSGGKLKLVAPDGNEESLVLKGPRCDIALPPDTL
jgi:prepilin-type N-terminal cleavage/methylation domain-containing protein